jgi:hypothetical protein
MELVARLQDFDEDNPCRAGGRRPIGEVCEQQSALEIGTRLSALAGREPRKRKQKLISPRPRQLL